MKYCQTNEGGGGYFPEVGSWGKDKDGEKSEYLKKVKKRNGIQIATTCGKSWSKSEDEPNLFKMYRQKFNYNTPTRNNFSHDAIEMFEKESIPDLISIFFKSETGRTILDNEIDKRIGKIAEKGFMLNRSREMSDMIAQTEIESYFDKMKNQGIDEIDLFDMSIELNLPFNQIDRIVIGMKEKGVEFIE